MRVRIVKVVELQRNLHEEVVSSSRSEDAERLSDVCLTVTDIQGDGGIAANAIRRVLRWEVRCRLPRVCTAFNGCLLLVRLARGATNRDLTAFAFRTMDGDGDSQLTVFEVGASLLGAGAFR